LFIVEIKSVDDKSQSFVSALPSNNPRCDEDAFLIGQQNRHRERLPDSQWQITRQSPAFTETFQIMLWPY
jgi:hypothetical protein